MAAAVSPENRCSLLALVVELWTSQVLRSYLELMRWSGLLLVLERRGAAADEALVQGVGKLLACRKLCFAGPALEASETQELDSRYPCDNSSAAYFLVNRLTLYLVTVAGVYRLRAVES